MPGDSGPAVLPDRVDVVLPEPLRELKKDLVEHAHTESGDRSRDGVGQSGRELDRLCLEHAQRHRDDHLGGVEGLVLRVDSHPSGRSGDGGHGLAHAHVEAFRESVGKHVVATGEDHFVAFDGVLVEGVGGDLVDLCAALLLRAMPIEHADPFGAFGFPSGRGEGALSCSGVTLVVAGLRDGPLEECIRRVDVDGPLLCRVVVQRTPGFVVVGDRSSMRPGSSPP